MAAPAASERQRAAAGYLGGAAVILILLLPLKFGSTAALPEVPSFPPPSLLSWLIFIWPPILFPVLAGLLLAGALLLLPPPRRLDAGGVVVLAWGMLAAASLLGGIHAGTWDFVILQWAHLFGLAAFAGAAWRIFTLRLDLRPWLIGAAVVGTLMTAVYGIHQYFWGFAETREFVAREGVRTGLDMMTGTFGQRLMENRVSATFAICNSFAAHLGLMLPICLAATWGNLRLQRVTLAVLATVMVWLSMTWWDTVAQQLGFSALFIATLTLALAPYPESWIRSVNIVMTTLAGILLIGALLLTQSRAGLLAVGIGILAATVLLPFPRQVRIGGGVLVVVGLCFGLWAINAGRGIESLVVRLDYWRAASGMMLEHPLAGAGWGEFFHGYPQVKQFPGTEAPHDPHNLIFSFASQCGVLGLLAALVALAAPLVLAWQACRRTPLGSTAFRLNAAIFTGWAIWSAHAMADINLQIAGTVATALLMILLIDATESVDPEWFPRFLRERATLRILATCWYALMIPVGLFALGSGWQRCQGEVAYQALSELCDPRFKTQEDYLRISPMEMERSLKACIDRMPYSPFPWKLAADFAGYRGAWGFVEKYTEEAVRRSPNRASFHYHLAVARLQLGRRQAAIESLRQAVALFPNHDGYRALLERLEADPNTPISQQDLMGAAQ
jgi:hypothetical protein